MRFGKSSGDVPNDIRGFLGEGTDINGEVRFTEILRVDGRISGKVFSEGGALLIGEGGTIEASIEAGTVSVSGMVKGTIRARTKVEIHSKGKVYGDVYTPNLMIEPGAVFDGKSHMGEQSAPADTRNLKIVDREAS
ncbi:MAG: polymer-forming cytoskeletal protein [Blastocatellia bacterium]